MINRFIFYHGVVIYFIMQPLFEKISKDSPCFPFKRGYLTSAILFILKVATAIIPHTKSDEIATMAMYHVLSLNFFVFLFVYVMLSNNGVKYDVYNVIFVDVISAINHIALNQSEKRSLFGQLTCPLFSSTKLMSYLCNPFTKQLFCVTAL